MAARRAKDTEILLKEMSISAFLKDSYPRFESVEAAVDERIGAMPEENADIASCKSLRFYRGDEPLLLEPLLGAPSCETSSSASVPPIPVYVIDFHRTMLTPHCMAASESERVASDEQLALFFNNVLEPELQSIEAHHPESGPRSAPGLMGVLLPSVLEGQLSGREWKSLCRDGALLDRIHYSYTILLHFYGWRLHDEETGEVDRHSSWRERYAKLDSNPAAYSALTRTIRVLIELRLPSYAGRFLRFILEELKAQRLMFLKQVYDSVWWPMLNANRDVPADLKKQLEKRRRQLDVGSDDDDVSEDSDTHDDDAADDAVEMR